MGVIVFGRLSIRDEYLKDLSFEEAKEKHPTIKENLLLGAWKIANPNGKLKKATKKED